MPNKGRWAKHPKNEAEAEIGAMFVCVTGDRVATTANAAANVIEIGTERAAVAALPRGVLPLPVKKGG